MCRVFREAEACGTGFLVAGQASDWELWRNAIGVNQMEDDLPGCHDFLTLMGGQFSSIMNIGAELKDLAGQKRRVCEKRVPSIVPDISNKGTPAPMK